MNNDTKKWIHTIAFVLTVIGGINQGLFAIIPADKNGVGFDLLNRLFGFNTTLFEFIGLMIGISAIYLLVTHAKTCRVCEAGK